MIQTTLEYNKVKKYAEEIGEIVESYYESYHSPMTYYDIKDEVMEVVYEAMKESLSKKKTVL